LAWLRPRFVSESTLFAMGLFEFAMGPFGIELLGIGLAKGVGLVRKLGLFAESAFRLT